MAIHFTSLPLTGILFTHFDEVTGVQTDICVSAVAEAVKRYQIVEVPLLKEHALLILKKRGLEEHRLSRLVQGHPTKWTGASPAFNPVLFLHMPDLTWLLADGSHRYVVGAMLGYSWIRARLVEEKVWREFEVEGLPRET